MDLETFIKTRKPTDRSTSPLWDYSAQLSLLKGQGYSSKRIVEWLSLNGVTISESRVRAFLIELGRKESKENKGTGLVENPKQSVPHAEQPEAAPKLMELITPGQGTVPHAEQPKVSPKPTEVVAVEQDTVPHAEQQDVFSHSVVSAERPRVSDDISADQMKEFLKYSNQGKALP